MFHQLHCLNELRKLACLNYYGLRTEREGEEKCICELLDCPFPVANIFTSNVDMITMLVSSQPRAI